MLRAMSPAVRLALSVLLFAVACADDEQAAPIDAATIDGATADAPVDAPGIDAPTDAIGIDAPVDAPSSVQMISCIGANPAQTITITGVPSAFTPSSVTITANQVIRFDPAGTFHNMTSGTPPSNANGIFATPNSQEACLRFTQAGTFAYYCSIHLFTGTITVN